MVTASLSHLHLPFIVECYLTHLLSLRELIFVKENEESLFKDSLKVGAELALRGPTLWTLA